MRGSPPVLPGTSLADSPLDRALALSLAGETESALRWSAAIVQKDLSAPGALILTCRLLSDAGRTEAAIEGFDLAVRLAVDAGNLPLAVAAVADLKALGAPVDAHLDDIAGAFCAGSARLSDEAAPPPPLPSGEEFHSLSSYLSGPALLSKVTTIIHDATCAFDAGDDDSRPLVAPLPLYSSLDRDALRALIDCFEMITVAAGSAVITEGEEGAEAFIVARGELEVRKESRDGDEPSITLARLSQGALFGEMALLSRAPRAASVVACRPSILLVARRDALESVAATRPEVGVELAAHCRRRMVANLVRASRILQLVAPEQRASLVERFETRVFESGDCLVEQGSDAEGLHLIASGEVSVVGREESGETFVIASLGVGETVGEVALVLRRKANADVVAVHPTITLHLPKEDYLALIREHPAVLAGLYFLAVERDEETTLALANSAAAIGDDYVLV